MYVSNRLHTFISFRSSPTGPAAIRGGIPIVFPVFVGRLEPDPYMQGFVLYRIAARVPRPRNLLTTN